MSGTMNERNAQHLDHNEGLVEVCVFARQRGSLHSPVDIWTGRLGLLNVAQLSDQFGRVIVWDDIRGDKTIPRSIGEILRAIETYYGFKPKIGTNASVHLGGIDGLARSTDDFFNASDFSFLKTAHQRIAVVDLGSCGTTRLRWLDLIPLLRRCYSHIVGIDVSAPEFCGLDPEFKLPHGLTGPQQEALYACDYWLLASDESISRQVDLSFEARSDAFTTATNELCGALASAECIKKAFGGATVHSFIAVGPGAKPPDRT
jgi:hypothetical protein